MVTGGGAGIHLGPVTGVDSVRASLNLFLSLMTSQQVTIHQILKRTLC